MAVNYSLAQSCDTHALSTHYIYLYYICNKLKINMCIHKTTSSTTYTHTYVYLYIRVCWWMCLIQLKSHLFSTVAAVYGSETGRCLFTIFLYTIRCQQKSIHTHTHTHAWNNIVTKILIYHDCCVKCHIISTYSHLIGMCMYVRKDIYERLWLRGINLLHYVYVSALYVYKFVRVHCESSHHELNIKHDINE